MDHQFSRAVTGKILLFGEHIVLHGAKGLAMPLPNFTMRYLMDDTDVKSHQILVSFLQFIESRTTPNYIALRQRLDVKSFEGALKNGLAVQSDIPMGAGLGSSGAFVALFYEYFCTDKKHIADELASDLSLLESAFHGVSSGIDPLVIFLNQPILIHHNQYQPISSAHHDYPLFVFDSKQSRSTSAQVGLFSEQLSNEFFKNKVLDTFIPLNDKAIELYLQGLPIETCFKQISIFQWDNMQEFIPHDVKKIWEKGLSHDSYYLKLCGAGGGGFFLGYSKKELPMENCLRLKL
jgi:mevalonate kinase